MAEDQKVPAADAPGVSPETSTDAGTESSEAAGETPADSQFDMAALGADITAATREEISRSEFELVKRQANQTRSLQRELAELKAEAARRGETVSRAEFDSLLEVLRDVAPADRLSTFEQSRAERQATSAVSQEFTAMEKRLFERLGIKDEDPAAPEPLPAEATAAAVNRAWQLASERVHGFAAQLGVEVTPADFQAAQAAANDDLKGSVERMVELIQSRAGQTPAAPAAPTREARIEERKAAAGGETPAGPRDGSQGKYDLSTLYGLAQARAAGAVTREQFAERYRQINQDNGR